MARIKKALLNEKSEADKQLAALKDKLDDDVPEGVRPEEGELDSEVNRFSRRIQAEAKAQAKENAEKLNSKEMAAALKSEEDKASIPTPREGMPTEVVTELDLSNEGGRWHER